MLSKIAKLGNVFTTSTSVGVAIRYLSTIAGTALAVLGLLGWLSQEQIAEINAKLPSVFEALGAFIMAVVPLYAMVRQSFSDKAAEVARQIDQKIPADAQVTVPTPGNAPDIKVKP